MIEHKFSSSLPDLPTVCPHCGGTITRSAPFAGIESADLLLYSCLEPGHGPKLYSATRTKDNVSGAPVWQICEV